MFALRLNALSQAQRAGPIAGHRGATFPANTGVRRIRGPVAHAARCDSCDNVRMVLGAGIRARLAAFPVFVLVLPPRCSLLAPLRDTGAIGPSAATPKQEESVGRVAAVPPPAPPKNPAITLPDAVVIKAIDAGQQAFLRCWARALESELPPVTGKVRLHLEIDEQGRVTAATNDAETPAFSRCLSAVARRLPFPAVGQPAVVEVPLMF